MKLGFTEPGRNNRLFFRLGGLRILPIQALSLLAAGSLVSGCAQFQQARSTAGRAVTEASIFASETVPLAIASPIVGVPEGQEHLKWYQRRIP